MGKWVKGQSGNPLGRNAGRPRLAKEIRRRYGEDGRYLLDRIEELFDNPKAKLEEKLAAITIIRDFGYGVPIPREAVEEAVQREFLRRYGENGQILRERFFKLVSEFGLDEASSNRLADGLFGLL